MCAACPIRVLCLEENLGERAGVWGGMTGRQRKRLRVWRMSGRDRWARDRVSDDLTISS